MIVRRVILQVKNTFNGTSITNSKTGTVPLYKPIKEVAFSELVAFINENIEVEEQPQTFQPDLKQY